jgi:serine/threonine protein kinase/tetratricopeptide (TPR) repeat protein
MTERDLFEAALDLPPENRASYLDGVCGGDAALRQRLEGLLSKHGRASKFLEEPALSALTTVEDRPVRERPGTLIGPYRLLEQIGEGGFGVVFLAEQQAPLRRKVALKVLKPGMDTRQVIARFEAERQALALMDHPNIARVFDGGETASGRPYFVMELVRGIPITSFCDQSELPIRERLGLFGSICQAMQHAHQKGIIHRDLKPSNVLVTLQESAPLVKVIDFGIAKALGQPLTDKTVFTGFAQLIGTPLYMSPEQAALSNVNVDTRSDIYSLGVLLYELLTGTPPLEEERFKQADYDEIRRTIREEEPPRPSMRISTLGPAATLVSSQRRSEPRRLCQLYRGELDWIVMKCLEKDRNRRYETVSALTADVQSYLNDERVLACPPSASYRLRKYARRNKTALAIGGLILCFIALLAGEAGWAVRDRAAREQELALEQAARQAKAANDLELALNRAELSLEQGKQAEARAAVDRAEWLTAEASPDPARDLRIVALKQRVALVHNNRGLALWSIGKFDEAIHEIRTATQLDSGNPLFHRNLGIARANHPQWREAAAAYERALELDPSDRWRWYMCAALQLYTGDRTRYRRACREMLVRFGNATEPDAAEQIAKTCLLAPDAECDFESVRKLADFAVERNGSRGMNGLTKALTEYRAGRYFRAIDWLGRVDPKDSGDLTDSTAFALLSMARQQQGQVREARAALDQAQAILARYPSKPGQRIGGDWHN